MTYAMCCLIMVAPEVVKILASKPYWEGIVIIPPVVLSNYIIFVYTMYVNVEHYYKKTVRISLYSAASFPAQCAALPFQSARPARL